MLSFIFEGIFALMILKKMSGFETTLTGMSVIAFVIENSLRVSMNNTLIDGVKFMHLKTYR